MMRSVLIILFLSFPLISGTLSTSDMLVAAAEERLNHRVIYDGRYLSIPYPMGDIPDSTGVCTDLVIRSYRKLGIDLQKLVHEDMKQRFSEYPSNWGLSGTDRNIDHRRVPNLQCFFSKHGNSLPISNNAEEYMPGDLVTWMLPGNLPHIGIVSGTIIDGRPLIIHNIGEGPKLEDCLFLYTVTGHYRYLPAN